MNTVRKLVLKKGKRKLLLICVNDFELLKYVLRIVSSQNVLPEQIKKNNASLLELSTYYKSNKGI